MINILIDEENVYNICGCNERTKFQSIDRTGTILDGMGPFPRYSEQPSRHALPDKESTLITHPTSLTTNSGWKTEEDFDSGIMKTIVWYLEKYKI